MGHYAMPGLSGKLVERGDWRARLCRDRRFTAFAILICLALGGFAEVTHRVARGENLHSIAKRYNTTPSAVAEANGVSNPNLIVIGQQLRIPDSAVTPAVPAATPGQGRTHTVASGESLFKIAAAYRVSVKALVEANALANPNRIHPGDVLKIPGGGPQTVEGMLDEYSRKYGVNPALVKALAWQESGWQQGVVSLAGAIGVMQVLPETGVFTGRYLLGKPVDLGQAEGNIETGVRFLAFLLEKTGGDERMAVAGYFQGLRSVRQSGVSPTTSRYVANVMALKQRFGG